MIRPADLFLHVLLVPVRLLGRLPLTAARTLTRSAAPLMQRLMSRRKKVVERNLALCFSHSSQTERDAMCRDHFGQLAEGLAETAVAWCRPGTLDQSFGEVSGLEHVQAAQEAGTGVLMLTGHATCIELGARLVGEAVPSTGIYRPLRQPVLEAFQNRGRARYAQAMIARDNVRAMVRHLRGGGVLWYAPDQDFGPTRSAFAPFFGIQTATATGLLDLARLGRACVVPMYPLKQPDGRVVVHFESAWEDFPSGNTERDLARFNAFLERYVRLNPPQYWWLHRRFKTAPPGEPDRYPASG
ncbi:MAG: lipid A biosynthesis acyltransferase [Wenzhouxiangella sp.]|jgi:KDO2-lipid IV(A) lauroyltransferase|nr:lipid A biosynthesis acyltransferase [Wenzhouxiangella sp.]